MSSSDPKGPSRSDSHTRQPLLFAAGQNIFEDEPYVWIIDKIHLDTTCSYCIKPIANKIGCPSCKQANYCSKECKKKDRTHHKLECKILQENTSASTFPTAETRLVIRALDRSTRELDRRQELVGDFFGNRRTIHDLISHLDDLSARARAEASKQAKFVFDLVEKHVATSVNKEQVLVLLQKCRINCHGLIEHDSPKRTLLGRAVYLAASKLNHSCVASTKYIQIFDGRRYKLRALCDMQVNDPLALTINYVPSSRSYACRRTLLEQNYHFTCQCEKCLCQAEQVVDVADLDPDESITSKIDEIIYLKGARWTPDMMFKTCESYLDQLSHLPDTFFYINQLLMRMQQACHDLSRFIDSVNYGVRALVSSGSTQNQQTCLFYLCQAFAALGYNERPHKYHALFVETLKLTENLYVLTHGRGHNLVRILDEMKK